MYCGLRLPENLRHFHILADSLKIEQGEVIHPLSLTMLPLNDDT